MSYMITISGRKISLPIPDPNEIKIEDIAAHLARMPRYNGATTRTYSVAQHSIAVGYLSVAVGNELGVKMGTDESVREGLGHDAEEMITGDMISPVKAELQPKWEETVRPIRMAVRLALDLEPTEPNHIYIADKLAFKLERDLGVSIPGVDVARFVPDIALEVEQKFGDVNEWYNLARQVIQWRPTEQAVKDEFLKQWFMNSEW